MEQSKAQKGPDEIAKARKEGEKVSLGHHLTVEGNPGSLSKQPAFFKHTPGLSVPKNGIKSKLEIKS